MAFTDFAQTIHDLNPLLQRTDADPRPVVLMTCGLAGAGKTTLGRAVLAQHPHFTRISIDAIIGSRHGIYGRDYDADPALYDAYMEEADGIYLAEFERLLAEGRDVLLERSFYAREDREEFRGLAEGKGARVVLVFLKAEGEEGKERLWERIGRRSEGVRTADSALEISREVFDGYWAGFEDPVGEGEVVVKVA
ncbi:P-loop containing nucleoside triphosphate hydrolase protein [Aaosphaeria arxii CBS 175.79]|uniref:P-loop containing nucleoside triphosphate hydrolase protein n=1 Tax=Aaosphaeria arxii CBS 175.79 TaxID=1450172 RepID=A0A6A5XD66_9PLEO|nr:P-loop containing nucleoside triphosphate hydrolase protein [Aaosphaeria arxii CBS 175.79]KAF2010938.1 P-loop containing nucleoside triphosphate hydrolase protein [Aaosphaeria arxii CBS 175.79]